MHHSNQCITLIIRLENALKNATSCIAILSIINNLELTKEVYNFVPAPTILCVEVTVNYDDIPQLQLDSPSIQQQCCCFIINS